MARKLKQEGARERMEELQELVNLGDTRGGKPLQTYVAEVLIECADDVMWKFEDAWRSVHPMYKDTHDLQINLEDCGPSWIFFTWRYKARGANFTDVKRQIEKLVDAMDLKLAYTVKIDGIDVIE